MVALVIRRDALKKPEFAGVNSVISTSEAEGGESLGKGHGDMALQAVCEITNPHPEIELVGVVPPLFYHPAWTWRR